MWEYMKELTAELVGQKILSFKEYCSAGESSDERRETEYTSFIFKDISRFCG